MKKVTISLYTIDELNDEARAAAVEIHRRGMLDDLRPDYIDGVTDWDDPEKMEMYEAEYDQIYSDDTYVVSNIRANEYLYYADGCLCWTCTYVSGPKKGIREYRVHGETYRIEEGSK